MGAALWKRGIHLGLEEGKTSGHWERQSWAPAVPWDGSYLNDLGLFELKYQFEADLCDHFCRIVISLKATCIH